MALFFLDRDALRRVELQLKWKAALGNEDRVDALVAIARCNAIDTVNAVRHRPLISRERTGDSGVGWRGQPDRLGSTYAPRSSSP